MKKLKLNKGIALGLIALLVAGVGVLSVVKAYGGDAPKVVVEGNYIEASSENTLGTAYTDATYATSNDVVTRLDSMYLWGDLEVKGTIYQTGKSNRSGLENYVSADTFADATTTLKCVINPLSATSTAEIRLDVTGVSTTTISMVTATSTSAYPTTLSAPSLVNAVVNTSTLATIISGITDTRSGNVSSGTNTSQRIVVFPNEYVCTMAGNNGGLGSTAGVTNAANTFAGTQLIKWSTF